MMTESDFRKMRKFPPSSIHWPAQEIALATFLAAQNRNREFNTGRLIFGDGGDGRPLMPTRPPRLVFPPGITILQQKQMEITYKEDMALFQEGADAAERLTFAFYEAYEQVQSTIAPNGFEAFGTLQQIYEAIRATYSVLQISDIHELTRQINNIEPNCSWEQHAAKISINISPLCSTEANKIAALIGITEPKDGIFHSEEHRKQHELNILWLQATPQPSTIASLIQYVLRHRGTLSIDPQANLAIVIRIPDRNNARSARSTNRGQQSPKQGKPRKAALISDLLTIATPGQASPNHLAPNNVINRPYCICHGWQPMNSKHYSGSCTVLSTDPAATPDMKTITHPCIITDSSGRRYVGSIREFN